MTVETKVSAQHLAAALRDVERSRSTSDIRPALTGVRLELNGAGLEIITTDSYRLTVATVPVEYQGVREIVGAATVPGGSLQGVLASIYGRKARTGDLLLTIPADGERVRLAGREITQHDGGFPNWRQLVPAEAPNVLTLTTEARETLTAWCRMVARVFRGKAATARARAEFDARHLRGDARDRAIYKVGREWELIPMRAILTAADEIHLAGLKVAAEGPDEVLESLEIRGQWASGEGPENPMVTYSGEDLTVGFSPTYLADALEATKAETVAWSGHGNPALKPALFQGPGRRGLLMPIRLKP